jgi:hypothetical protein
MLKVHQRNSEQASEGPSPFPIGFVRDALTLARFRANDAFVSSAGIALLLGVLAQRPVRAIAWTFLSVP